MISKTFIVGFLVLCGVTVMAVELGLLWLQHILGFLILTVAIKLLVFDLWKKT